MKLLRFFVLALVLVTSMGVVQMGIGQIGIQVSASARAICGSAFSHELEISWRISSSSKSIEVTIEITDPTGRTITLTQPELENTIIFPLDAPGGGTASIRITARDAASGSTASAQASASLTPCRAASRGESDQIDVGVVISLSGPGADLGQCIRDGVQSEADFMDDVIVDFVDDRGRPELQVTEALQLLEQPELDALILHPIRTELLGPVVNEAQRRGVRLVSIGTEMPGSEFVPIPQTEGGCRSAGQVAIDTAVGGSSEPGIIVDPFPDDDLCQVGTTGAKIKRPRVESVNPAQVQIPSRGPITVTGEFHANPVAIRLRGPETFVIGPLQVSQQPRPGGGTIDTVTFELPVNMPPGNYIVIVDVGAAGPNCTSREGIHLFVLPPQKGDLWYVAVLKEVKVKDSGDDADNQPGENRFILGGVSNRVTGSGAQANARTVTYPSESAPFVALTDTRVQLNRQHTVIHPNVPIFWDRKDLMGPNLKIALLAYEHDGGSAFRDWFGLAAEVIGFGVGCWLGGSTGCTAGQSIASNAFNKLTANVGKDDPAGSVELVCRNADDYCIGQDPDRIVERDLPINKMAPLYVELREVEGPIIDEIQVRLHSVQLLVGQESDDGMKHKGEDIWLAIRVSPGPLATGNMLNRSFRLPEQGEYHLCTVGERKRFPGPCADLSDAVIFNPSSNVGLLYPLEGDVQVQGESVPFLYVEIGVWEQDEGNKVQLVGMHSQILWLQDVLRDKAEYRERFSVMVEAPFVLDCGFWACGSAIGKSKASIVYEVLVRRGLHKRK
jgi:hypothetical protein